MKGKVSLAAFPVLLYDTLLGHFTVPKFILLCNGIALTPEEDDTCFGMVRNTAHTERYNRSLLIRVWYVHCSILSHTTVISYHELSNATA